MYNKHNLSESPSLPCLLFIAGGYQVDGGIDTVELVDLCSDGNRVCPTIPQLPKENYVGVSLKTKLGHPLLCGGWFFDFYEENCYKYSPNDGNWTRAPDPSMFMDWAAFAEQGDNNYWVFGDNEQSLRYISEVGSFIPGPNTPEEPSGFSYSRPCAVKVDSDTTFYGGSAGYLFDSSEGFAMGSFVPTAQPMLFPAYNAHCGAATLSDGSRIVVVAGGNPGFEEVLSRSAILDVSTGVWSPGPDLPQPMAFGTVVPTEESFLIVGGADVDDIDLDTILMFDALNMEWVILEQRLSSPKQMPFALAVDKEEFCPQGKVDT